MNKSHTLEYRANVNKDASWIFRDGSQDIQDNYIFERMMLAQAKEPARDLHKYYSECKKNILKDFYDLFKFEYNGIKYSHKLKDWEKRMVVPDIN